MTNLVESSFFTTHGLPSEQRLPLWRESISTIFDITPPASMAAHQFNARLSSYLVNNQIMLSKCQTGAQRFERTPLRIARDGLDYFLLQTHVSGSQEITRAGRRQRSRHGDLMIIDLAGRHDAEATDFTNLSLVVPRHLLAPHLNQPDSQGGRIIRGEDALTTLAVNHMKMLTQTIARMTPCQAEQIIEPTLLLMASALNGSTDSVAHGNEAVRTHLKTRARLLIDNNLTGNLSPDHLCKQLHISRASLYRLFAAHGGVQAYIQDRRLKRCAEALLNQSNMDRRIYDIAFSWGFHSEAHFSRAFRAKFGLSPSDARERSRQLSDRRASINNLDVGDRYYEHWLSERLR